MKLLQWLSVMLKTKTVNGPMLGFQRAYLMHTFLTVLKRLRIPKNENLKKWFEETFDQEMIVHNELGTFSINPKNDSLTKSIPTFELNHQDWLKQAERKNIFIDIGANIGFYSLLATTRYGYASAVAFEPNPETFKRLEQNVNLNKLSPKVRLFSCGLSDTHEVSMLMAQSAHTGASSFAKTQSDNSHAVAVETHSFDAITKENSINPEDISFIKIDVEGFEHRVLKGMEATLSSLLPGTVLFIEIHPRDPHADHNKDLLQKHGFVLQKTSPQHNYLYVKSADINSR